jgi:ribonuclease E
MTKRMLVDAAHPEETRVAIVDGNWLSDFDFERTSKKQLKGNIYLAKVIRIEPSLQAAFVEYGGNRHGFLSFSEIHPDYFRIPMADRPPGEEQTEEDDDHANGAEAGLDGGQDNNEPLQDETIYEPDEPEITERYAENVSAGDESVTPPTTNTSPFTDASSPVSEFPFDTSPDLGLITDFGHAAVNPMPLAPPPIPVETVGGEAVEDERFRRQPRPRYKIQEVVKRRQVMLTQVVKEERGNKGAALTTFLSLAGRYCVLMPNTDHGGGVSRKITSHQDRRRMKEILDQLEIPEGMAVILRTAGMEQEPAEIQRDLEFLLRMWNNIREETLQSTAPTLIYEEANLIKRSMRDLYAPDLSEILVAGARGHQLAIDFMRTIMPDQLDKVKSYEDQIPLFFRYNVEKQIDQLYNPTVQLRSGGYIVINPTEALVSIDVNSGRATRERHIEGTALKTNLEAAEEIARQLRLRDLAGLVVIDFIDMEDGRNNAAVERRLKDAMRADRARLQIGRISPFGLLELSRQRLRPSLMEINFEKCPHCTGIGLIRSVDSAAISILRMIEEEGIRQGADEIVLHVPTKVALYILNQKRSALSDIERRYSLQVLLHSDDELVPPHFRLERGRDAGENRGPTPAVNTDRVFAENEPVAPSYKHADAPEPAVPSSETGENNFNQNAHGRRRGRYGQGRHRNGQPNQQPATPSHEANGNFVPEPVQGEEDNIGNTEGGDHRQQDQDHLRRGGRRRGRRGGRGRGGGMGGGGRGPKDNSNYVPRHERHDQTKSNWHDNPVAAVPVPTSIHDIDTTPRQPRPSSSPAHLAPEAQRPVAPTTPAAPPYEIVDQAPDKPKGGWWHKLTGQ